MSVSIKSQEENQSVDYLKKICETLSQQITSICEICNASKIPELSQPSIDKYLSAFKQNIIRTITVRLPQVMAIQQKYRAITIEANEQLNEQKRKNKELQTKYQDKILENDRIKMETVELNENYTSAIKDYENKQRQIMKMGRQIQQLKGKIQEYQNKADWNLVENDRNKVEEQKLINQVHQLQERGEQFRQQKILYQKQLKALQQQLLQSQQANKNYQRTLISLKERINQLQSEAICQEQKSSLLEEQMKNQIILNQQLKYRQEELLEQIKKLQGDQQGYLKSIQQEQNRLIESKSAYIIQIQDMKKKNSELEEQAGKVNKYGQVLEEKLKLQEQDRKQLESTIVHMREQFDKKLESIQQNKIALESKFIEKIKMLQKKQNDFQDKNKKLKQENERLYEAIDRYAKDELRVKKKYEHCLINKEKAEQHLLKTHHKQKQMFMKIRVNFQAILKREIAQYRKQIGDLRSYILTGFHQTSLLLESDKFNIMQKLNSIQKSNKIEFHKSLEDITIRNQQNEELKKMLKNQEVKNKKMVESILESKQLLIRENQQKDHKIRDLQTSLHQEKLLHQNIINSFQRSIKKYHPPNSDENLLVQEPTASNSRTPNFEKFNHHSKPNILSTLRNEQAYIYTDIDEQIKKQKSRFENLRNQYHNLMGK